jgi:hypothetical protein
MTSATIRVMKCSTTGCPRPATWKHGTWWACDEHIKEMLCSPEQFERADDYPGLFISHGRDIGTPIGRTTIWNVVKQAARALGLHKSTSPPLLPPLPGHPTTQRRDAPGVCAVLPGTPGHRHYAQGLRSYQDSSTQGSTGHVRKIPQRGA